MVGLRVAASLFGMVIAAGTGAFAQGLEGPVSLPPSSFTGMTFNDANGCAFTRAGVSGSTVWVARVDQSRQPICGLAPTFGPEAPATPAPEPVMAETPTPTPPPPAVATDRSDAPIATVATLTTAPYLTPAPVPAPVVTAARQETRRTVAEACAGRTGVQPGLIRSSTGQPIDCGGTPIVTSAAMTGSRQAQAVPRMTIAQACAQSAASGLQYINQATGLPVDCPATTASQVTLASAPAGLMAAPLATAETPRMTLSSACMMSQQTGIRYINAATNQPINCGAMVANADAGHMTAHPAVYSPGFNTAAVAQTVQAQGSTPLVTLPFGIATSVPNSNPTGVVRGYTGPPPGYEPVWTDGRLNPDRGIPPDAAGHLSSRNVPVVTDAPAQVMMSGHRYVQVGTYGDPANAQRAAATLHGLGLPVGLATFHRNGAALQVVAAGPFSSAADLDAALRAARAAGYSDAFTRS
jgi:hypothetical protein